MKKLINKTVLITGGLSGIGLSCAIAAAQHGANTVIADLESELTDKVMKEIKTENNNAVFVNCDVSVYNQVQQAIEKSVEMFGTIDVALNNAGIGGKPAKTGDLTELDWKNVIDINLNGVFYCMKHELTQMMKQKRGIIVNMSSILGKVGFATAAHYVAAKHGVIGLTQAAAIEYAESGIRVNAICPGFIDTPMLASGGITDNDDVKKMIEAMHPMKRLGRAQEIASGFIFLACDESSFMTGATLDIDGGFLVQ